MLSSNITIHHLLFVLPEDSQQTIKKAFLKLSLVFHPDKWAENEQQATAAFQKIKNAYEILTQ
jgi:DnaJ-class molecular chaperone